METFNYNITNKDDVFQLLLTSKNSKLKEEKTFLILFPDLYQELNLITFPTTFTFPQKLYHFFQNDYNLSLGKCSCGNRCRFISFIKGYVKHCSKNCAMSDESTKEKYRNTCIELYGTDNFSKTNLCNELKKKTCNEKYGVDNVFQLNDIKEKRKDTLLKTLGVDIPMKSEKCVQQYKLTSRKRCGKDHSMQTEEGKTRYKETCLRLYGENWYSKTDEYKNQYKEIQEKINKTKKENNTFSSSSIEQKIKTYFLSHKINFIKDYTSTLYPFNCDFYLPDYDLYIEIQGTWTHGGHPYDENNNSDIKRLNIWRLKESKYYDNAIETWTIRDVKKRNIAKKNNLKYIEIFSVNVDTVIKQITNKIKELK